MRICRKYFYNVPRCQTTMVKPKRQCTLMASCSPRCCILAERPTGAPAIRKSWRDGRLQVLARWRLQVPARCAVACPSKTRACRSWQGGLLRVVAGAALAVLGNNGARLQVLTRKAIANPGRTGASKSRKMVSCKSWQRERLQILARMALASAGEVGSCKFRHGGRLQILTKRALASPGKVGSCKSWRRWRLHGLAKMALGKTVAQNEHRFEI